MFLSIKICFAKSIISLIYMLKLVFNLYRLYNVSIFDFVVRMYVVHIYISILRANEQRPIVVFSLKVYTKCSISLLKYLFAIIMHFSFSNFIFSLVKIVYLLHCLRLLSLTVGPASNRQNSILFACY